MAKCVQCSAEMGCSCNLINGFCARCYNLNLENTGQAPAKRKTGRVVYEQNSLNTVPNTEFNVILKSTGMSKEEKLRRINEILEKAINNQQ